MKIYENYINKVLCFNIFFLYMYEAHILRNEINFKNISMNFIILHRLIN